MAKYVWERLSGSQLIFAVNFITAFGIFFEGWNQGNMGFASASPEYQEIMGIGSNGKVTSPVREGGIVAVYYLGGLIGGLLGGHIADKYGRVKATLVGACWVLVGGALMSSAMNIAWICCARVIAGIGVGFFITVIPVWSAEVAHSEHRGSAFSWLFVANFAGIFCAYWTGFGLSFIKDPYSTARWRIPLALQVLAPAIMIPLVWMLPESPRWLIKEDRHEEALRIITVLRGDGDPDHPDVRREYVEVVKTLEEDKKLADFNSYWRMATDFKKDGLHYGRRALLAFGIQMLVEVATGIALTTIYAPTIFSQAGFAPLKVGWLSGINGLMGVLGTISAVFLCDRLGRRTNLMIGNAIMGTLMWIFSGLTKAAIDHPEKQAVYGTAGVAMILLFTFTLCVFWMIVCFIYAAEIFPTALRAKGNGFLTAGWGIGIGTGVFWFPPVVASIGYKTFYIFGVLNYVSLIIVYCFFPETAGRSLESIDLLFRSNSWFVWNNEKDFKRLKAEHDAMVSSGLASMEKASTVEDERVVGSADKGKLGPVENIEKVGA
ncbi:hypothetical protein LTR99_001404 [Exophiala xenobiotica]|uniref:Major facilitator superfamily (MFS) profile domain-containing protein n=1 Tax=Vermiconidia calcicola TaxID=1690605 RepID=A0AAV9QLD9_9PEZI|nr:hypothetical protein LTR92_001837 [Exophiala xenobiotica]KAK5545968.1 hypothetical protein LTR25_000978 [Vermiconidia calcicola]KAK5549775.1 hypothetical protein LTR23_000066 [Chaetothyriales sp. CCFEE 6169]KAK5229653.1 hypothetical protein LTR72_001185 [Exophiala xenobiotica]KAK5232018.1 hypothetical protein LTR47_006859 [Exophiala xenobiotica]